MICKDEQACKFDRKKYISDLERVQGAVRSKGEIY